MEYLGLIFEYSDMVGIHRNCARGGGKGEEHALKVSFYTA